MPRRTPGKPGPASGAAGAASSMQEPEQQLLSQPRAAGETPPLFCDVCDRRLPGALSTTHLGTGGDEAFCTCPVAVSDADSNSLPRKADLSQPAAAVSSTCLSFP